MQGPHWLWVVALQVLYEKVNPVPSAGMVLAMVPVRGGCYFPMQKRPKISPRISSVSAVPMICPM